MTPLLELEDVHARYGETRALHGVSLRVDEGSSLALLGANGAGKTTTLRAVSGLVRKTGHVSFAGRSIARKTPEAVARLGVAHVPQGRGIIGDLTVSDNLRLGAYTSRDRAAVKADLAGVLEQFPRLGERLSQAAGTLSGGEQQMLALGRALLQRPRLLMLDEPSLGLAPLIVREIFDVLERLNREEGLAVLVVEQDAAVALRDVPRGLRARGRPRRPLGAERGARRERVRAEGVPGLLMDVLAFTWTDFAQQVVSGLATGSIYASLALAIVIIYRATAVINFAQGEMAMFSTFIAWWLDRRPERARIPPLDRLHADARHLVRWAASRSSGSSSGRWRARPC